MSLRSLATWRRTRKPPRESVPRGERFTRRDVLALLRTWRRAAQLEPPGTEIAREDLAAAWQAISALARDAQDAKQ